MKYKIKTNLLHDKKEYVPGDVVDLSEKQAAPLLPDVVEPVETMPTAPASTPTPENTEDAEEELSYRELQEKAHSLGLSAKGSKEELMERIAEDEARTAELPAADATAGTLPEDENPGADL
jgi:hypothetical protein